MSKCIDNDETIFDNFDNKITNKMLTVEEASRHLKISVSMLNKMRGSGSGPSYFQFGRAIRYRQDDLDNWAIRRRARNTADANDRLPRRMTDVLTEDVSGRRQKMVV